MDRLIGLGLLLFFLVNLVAWIIIVYKNKKEENISFFKVFMTLTLELILGTFGLYVAIVLGSLLLGIALVFYQ
ncbi:hypothetical protein [Peribacillus asahii]|uniref:Uncharacterized protein n=1 Tax=Peribacillus asahii TaxID=228899 RepID=A0A3T0KS12_9BACI|nr:hypothetical protein [Peribacillus asahii]AZV43011.1 hypothetical protein BAOM_2402 [Peribacillus asahii]USK83142.1 hypothetical protein LIT35_11525 [Peribacillus asahii]